MRALKDDGCNTNVISRDFVEKNRHRLTIINQPVTINHSEKDEEETVNEVVINAEIKLGNLTYNSNWAIGNIRYDVILGVPWHEHYNPDIDNDTKQVRIGHETLPLLEEKGTDDRIKISKIGVKKFRNILRKNNRNPDIFYVQNITSNINLENVKLIGPETKKIRNWKN